MVRLRPGQPAAVDWRVHGCVCASLCTRDVVSGNLDVVKSRSTFCQTPRTTKSFFGPRDVGPLAQQLGGGVQWSIIAFSRAGCSTLVAARSCTDGSRFTVQRHLDVKHPSTTIDKHSSPSRAIVHHTTHHIRTPQTSGRPTVLETHAQWIPNAPKHSIPNRC